MTASTKGFLYGLSATAFWGSFYPASRFLLGNQGDSLDPLSLTFLRYIFAVLFLLPFVLRKSSSPLFRSALRNDWRKLILLSLIGIVAEGVLVFVAGRYTTAGRCTLMANASPIFTVILAFLFLKEALTRRKITGMLLGFAGITLIILSRSGADMFGSSELALRGDLMALGSACCWAIYTVFGRDVSQKYGGMLVTAILFAIGTLLMIPIMLLFGSSWNFHFDWQVWLGIAYIGGLTNGIANALWYRGLAYLPAGRIGAFGYLSAFIAVTLSALLLHEVIGWQFLLSAAMVMGGVYLMMAEKQ